MSNPVKPQSAMTKNGQPFYPLTTIDQVLDSDGGRLSLDSTIQTYTHTKSGTVHNLAGTSTNGRVKFTADYSVGDTFTLNGSAVSVYVGDGERISFKSGQYAYLIVDGSIVHLFGTNKKSVTVNLLRPTLQTTTINGVTITNNGDGTYTLNGTATTDIRLEIGFVNKSLIGKTLKLLGCPPNGSYSTYYFQIRALAENDYGDGKVFTVPDTVNDNDNMVRIGIASGYTCNNLLFKPMLTTDLTATYDDFVSYDESLVTGSNQYFFGGIDKDRVLATFTNNGAYTATEDCWAYIYQPNYSANVHIDGMIFKVHGHGDGTDSYGIFPMKKGMEIWIESSSGVSITVYGIKR